MIGPRDFIKSAIASVVRHDAIWNLLDATVLKVARHAERERRAFRRGTNADTLVAEALQRRVVGDAVRHGPFAGMTVPAVGDTPFPKLLGCYERELAPVMEQVLAGDYTEVVVIGCGEGYYAVGLALGLPRAHVYAFDIDPDQRQRCLAMARANGVADRITLAPTCTASELATLPRSGRRLILSDCEGHELALFAPGAVRELASDDVLVEAHDFVDVSISTTLASRFAASHRVERVDSVDDVRKPHVYEYPELEDYDMEQRRVLLAEHRPTAMEWLWMRPRTETAVASPTSWRASAGSRARR